MPLMERFCRMSGVFFQWISCIGIFSTGFVLNGIRLFPEFFPLAMLGGFLWCTGKNLYLCEPENSSLTVARGSELADLRGDRV